jgi:hypothetical protein
VAPRTTVHQSIANRRVRFDVAYSVIDARPELSHSKLALEQLTPRRMARNGSRPMMKSEELEVTTLPGLRRSDHRVILDASVLYSGFG